ncbi:hypothetical protein OG981_02430 [Streptomyces mirabilis]|uniref:hypothetical protein n=1 Tax=Streptomyces mirabilis TaxID=68239 RepID=UPI002E24B334
MSDGQGRTLWSGAQRPGRMHDQTSVHTEGIAEQFHQHPGVRAEVDDGYRGLASESLDRVSAPPRKLKGKAPNDGPVTERYGWREMKRRQSLRRICRARQRRSPPVAPAPVVHRPPRDLLARPTSPSTPWSPTAPPNNPPGTTRAPSWYTSAPRPAEPPACLTHRPTRPKINRGSARWSAACFLSRGEDHRPDDRPPECGPPPSACHLRVSIANIRPFFDCRHRNDTFFGRWQHPFAPGLRCAGDQCRCRRRTDRRERSRAAYPVPDADLLRCSCAGAADRRVVGERDRRSREVGQY